MTRELYAASVHASHAELASLRARVAELEAVADAAQAYVDWAWDHTSTALGGARAWTVLKVRLAALAPRSERREGDALDDVRPCVCGCRRSKHQGENVDGECADCMGYCKSYQPAPAAPKAPEDQRRLTTDPACPKCADLKENNDELRRLLSALAAPRAPERGEP